MSLSIKRGVIAVATVLASTGAWPNRYTIVDLGHVNYEEGPVAVNRVGAIAANTGFRGQVYRGGRWHNLPPHSEVFSIDRAGDIVGDDFKQRTAMLWPHNAEPVVLPLPGDATSGTARGINNTGTIVGDYILSGGFQCFMWSSAHGAIDLGEGQLFLCSAHDVNRAGQITGRFAIAEFGGDHAFLWEQGTFLDLGILPGTGSSEGLAINDGGVIVGISYNSSEAPKGFMWNGSLIDLDSRGEFFAVTPLAINNAGEVVGWVREDGPRGNMIAVRFSKSGIHRLESEVVDIGDWKLRTATSVNDEGVVVGQGDTADGSHGFMLIPSDQE
jgi:probable HAF family extracellular repeat protein